MQMGPRLTQSAHSPSQYQKNVSSKPEKQSEEIPIIQEGEINPKDIPF